jgi:hypothetical protein
MALFTGFQLPVEKKLAGLVVVAGYLPGSKRFRYTRFLYLNKDDAGYLPLG